MQHPENFIAQKNKSLLYREEVRSWFIDGCDCKLYDSEKVIERFDSFRFIADQKSRIENVADKIVRLGVTFSQESSWCMDIDEEENLKAFVGQAGNKKVILISEERLESEINPDVYIDQAESFAFIYCSKDHVWHVDPATLKKSFVNIPRNRLDFDLLLGMVDEVWFKEDYKIAFDAILRKIPVMSFSNKKLFKLDMFNTASSQVRREFLYADMLKMIHIILIEMTVYIHDKTNHVIHIETAIGLPCVKKTVKGKTGIVGAIKLFLKPYLPGGV